LKNLFITLKNTKNTNDFIFYPNKYNAENEVSKRSKKNSKLMIKYLKLSQIFPVDKFEMISSQMFRCTRILKTSQEININEAQMIAGHSDKATTYYKYIVPEKRGIFSEIKKNRKRESPTLRNIQ
jgi:hypothetical protein